MAEGSVDRATSTVGLIERGRAALTAHDWQGAYDALAEVDRTGALAGADLEALAQAAFFTARPDEVLEVLERAYAAYVAEDDQVRAAFLALELTRELGSRGRSSIAAAWMRRAERALEGHPESYATGYLALVRSDLARIHGDVDGAIALAEEAVAIGERTRDAELQAWGISGLGRLRIMSGAPADGIALLEEASIAAVSGELSPFASGVIACSMIAACRELTDYQRASEWIEATDRYCARQSVSGFPGACRIHKAEIVAQSGGWARAERELEVATSELGPYKAGPPLADGYYALGEVRRLRGDLEGAEEALREAHALGRMPYPALALVRLAQGRQSAARSAIDGALATEVSDRLGRVKLLPALVEIALAGGDVAAARAAADELGELVTGYDYPAPQASAEASLGRVLLAEGDAAGAARALRVAMERWRKVPNPYEVARCRRHLAAALRALGDGEDAALELDAARDELERLGAVIDLAELDAVRRRAAAPAKVHRTFLFTDIVGSTRLAEALGDEAWEGLLAWHDRTIRGHVDADGGRIVTSTGDGFFAAFEASRAAIDCAIAIQRALADHRASSGFALDVRIGIHAADATERGDDFSGVGVHVAARVAALAAPREILATAETITEAGLTVAMTREAELKGVTGPVQVAAVDWT
jgi:class 3 adenylate cyclase